MKALGALYVGKLEYYHKRFLPIIEFGWTQETDRKYRYGRCLVFRLPFTKPGVYIGVFYKRAGGQDIDDDTIDELIFKAMKGRNAWKPQDGDYDEFFKE